MSIDFDSAALQTQQEEEEYDQEDYAREQELHKLLTDLPDDMLEDSRECSSPELDRSNCSHQGDDNRPQHAWNVPQWEHPRSSHEEHYEEYDQGSYHEDYSYRSHTSQTNSHPHHLQTGTEHLPTGWDPQNGQNYQYQNRDYAHSSADMEESHGSNFSAGDRVEEEGFPHNAVHHGAGYHGAEVQNNGQNYGEQNNVRNNFQVFDNGGAANKPADHYKATYHPHQPSNQPKMFNPQAATQNGHFDQLQRDFLNSTQNTAEGQQLAQLQILNRAQSRQIEELEQKLEDCRRRMRYLEHQFAIVKDEKDGLTISLKESSALVEEAKERESQLQGKIRSLEKQIQILTEREKEIVKQQCVAEAAMDSMQQQMKELCRSDTLSRAREQHDRDTAAIREQYEARLLTLQQKLDAQSQSLDEEAQTGQRLLDQVRQLERQREKDQVDRASVINMLTQRLEESQQQCAKLLHTGSVQEMNQLQMKLQQAQSARSISEDLNKALQEELTELKEQINLYESAVKHGALLLETNGDWENQFSESYMNLGIKKSKWRNGRIHSTPRIAEEGDSGLPKDDVVRELKIELQRCLSYLKTKRLKISELQEELRSSQSTVEKLQTKLEQAEKTTKDSKVRESSLEIHLESSRMNAAPHKELVRLQEERQLLQKRVETLEKRNQELKQSEDKLKAANSELCTKMREMIQELDQEKQEAAERYEMTQQQYRDDVVNCMRAELTQEHTTHIEQLNSEHQQHMQELKSKLIDLSQEVLAVQECYISVCKEKDKLEENLQNKLEEERRLNILKSREESEGALDRLRSDLEHQHQEGVSRLRAQWRKETQAEIELQVREQLDVARQSWQQEQEMLEKAWAQRLQEAEEEIRKVRQSDTCEGACQTSCLETVGQLVSVEELEARLSTQRENLQQEATATQAKAVEEAVRCARRDLQQKHADDIALQVEDAISRARSRWLQDLTSLPEYKSNLQVEKDEWERLQQQHVQEQVSSAVKAAEDRWQEMLHTKCTKLEECNRRNGELQEEVRSLSTLLERSCQEQAALIKAELAAAQDVWIRDKQEEISSLRAELQREHKLQAVLEQNLQQILKQKDTELQKTLREKEQEWRSQQKIRLQEEMQRGQEEVLADLKEVLQEVQEGVERRGSQEGQKPSNVTGTLRSKLWEICRESLIQTVNQAKQEWKKVCVCLLIEKCSESSEDKLRRVLKETQERHEAEITGLMARRKQGECSSAGCAESLAKLQKKNQELQKHLEKACRQLQRTVREHKSTLLKMKDDHEAALQKERENHLRGLEELKQTANTEALSSGAVSQQNLQAGLEEMKEQYMKAVEEIKGDMLRYLQESKERAAELIRAEVLRERQDTARRMRRYYLTCLQELLEDGCQTTGAEKKIINAASKLAAMAKVLETPVSKRKLSRTQNSQGGSAKSNIETNNSPAKVLGAASHEAHKDGKDKKIHQIYSLTETNFPAMTAKQKGIKQTSKGIELESLKSGMPYGPKDTEVVGKVPHNSQKCTQGGFATCSKVVDDGIFNSDVKTPNVTLRKQSREMFMEGFECGRTDHSIKPFLIEEDPVRDDGQSDWILTNNSSIFMNNIHLTSSYPQPGKPFSMNGPSLGGLDFGSTIGDNSEVTVYQEIVKPPSKPNVCADSRTSKNRGQIPGSEAESVRKMCPKSLFSELKVCQRDSGLDSPLALLQK
ncbi:centrosomal protein of 152 kDa-like isoform X3 [Myxocyprinus asiaticus]|uniref:centrosomal protein of 152 kDa-like isoform X3 n=1 Tax=Myxocyprinus asiaticus TaxID=70543 RepID=UPI0022233CED|nr:centrosomal protein of 152 kDa-like isoform X3 [Myxocyprinus asiaticus]